MSTEEEFELDAAGLRLDGSDLRISVEVLASKLESALPAATRVQRRRRNPLSKDQRVRELEVRLGESCFSLQLRDGALQTWRAREVGGIAIKREPLDPAAWVGALAGELHAQAQRSADARLALTSLLS